jgi:long-chain acyl-CoA synthetase
MEASANTSTISDFFASSVTRRGDEQALGFIRSGELRWRTWREVADEAAGLASVMRSAGVERGDRVAHVSENRYEWIITDLAIHLAGAIHVPIHVTLSPEQIAEQVVDSGGKLVFASTEALWASLADHMPQKVPHFVHDAAEECSWRAQLHVDGAFSALTSHQTAPETLATILYTSGTTGRPRGVMLSHSNLASNASAVVAAFPENKEETRLCILPLSHIYARTCDLYTWVCRGSRLALGQTRETLAGDLQLVRPTALNAVPFLFQRVADRIRAAGGDEAAALRGFFGGRMQMLNSGGAPLAPELERWYADHGLPVLIGYGLTETSPVVSFSTPQSYKPGSVGRLLPGVEVRIADDGEILVRGPNIMLGHWRDDAATAQVIRDGWFHTGDLGELDADGFLSIRGRKKELIVLSTGKKVVPTRVELLLVQSPLIRAGRRLRR